MDPATHPMENKWEPTYLQALLLTHRHTHTPTRPKLPTPRAVLPTLCPRSLSAGSSILPNNSGGLFELAPVTAENLSHNCEQESKVWVTYVLHPAFMSFLSNVGTPRYRCIKAGAIRKKASCMSWLTCIPRAQKVALLSCWHFQQTKRPANAFLLCLPFI